MGGPRIAVNYVAMEEAAAQIKSSSKSIEDISNQLKQQLQKIDWEGADQQAYDAQMVKWNQALADMNAILHQISGAVETARQGYGDVEDAGVRSWS
jgi:WXG100 family type VII secretion target